MDFFDLPFWQDFLSNLAATIIGVIIGIPVAISISRAQEKQTENTKTYKILTVLNDELSDSLITINDWRKSTNKIDDAIILSNDLYDEAWSVFSEGGEIEWIKDYAILLDLAWAYGHLKKVKNLSVLLFELSQNQKNASSSIVKRISEKLDKEAYYFILSCESALKQIREYI